MQGLGLRVFFFFFFSFLREDYMSYHRIKRKFTMFIFVLSSLEQSSPCIEPGMLESESNAIACHVFSLFNATGNGGLARVCA